MTYKPGHPYHAPYSRKPRPLPDELVKQKFIRQYRRAYGPELTARQRTHIKNAALLEVAIEKCADPFTLQALVLQQRRELARL